MPLSPALTARRAPKARKPAPLYLVSDNPAPKAKKGPGGRPKAKPGAPTHRLRRELLTRAEVAELFAAIDHAKRFLARRAGRIIPAGDFYFVTVTWGLTGWRDTAAPVAIRELLQRSGGFLRAAGEPLVWAYTQEWGPTKGVHFHLVIYVPTAALQRKFAKRFRAWLKLPRRPHRAGGDLPVVFEPVHDMDGLLRYLTKDSPDDVRAEFHIPEKWPRTGGAIYGKRLAVSRSINANARKAAALAAGNVVQITPFMRRAA